MADVFGALAQVYPAATTLTNSYTVPTGKRATVEVVMCNQGGASAAARVSHAIGGAADTSKQYLVYGVLITASDTRVSGRFTVNAGDIIRVWSDTGTISFNINGVEEDA